MPTASATACRRDPERPALRPGTDDLVASTIWGSGAPARENQMLCTGSGKQAMSRRERTQATVDADRPLLGEQLAVEECERAVAQRHALLDREPRLPQRALHHREAQEAVR